MHASPTPLTGPIRTALALSVPVAALAMIASGAGVFVEATYARETSNWAAQARGQDVVNLVVAYPALLALAWVAARGSVRAYLAWLGVMAYSAYSYLLYAGFLHFSAWFLVYVVVLGLSCAALVVGLVSVSHTSLSAAVSERAPTRAAGRVLIVMGVLFALLWMSEIVPAALDGGPLTSAADAGLVTNPVYVLDLAVFLPAMVVVGALLIRRRPLALTLALTLFGWGVVLGTAVIGMFVSMAMSGEELVVVPVVMMTVAVIVKAVVAGRLLGAVDPGVDLGELTVEHVAASALERSGSARPDRQPA